MHQALLLEKFFFSSLARLNQNIVQTFVFSIDIEYLISKNQSLTKIMISNKLNSFHVKLHFSVFWIFLYWMSNFNIMRRAHCDVRMPLEFAVCVCVVALIVDDELGRPQNDERECGG